MKKRLLSLLITLIFTIALVPSVAFAAIDPFSPTRAIDYDEVSGFTPVDWGSTSYNLGSGSLGSYVKFAGVDFGTKKGVTFSINHTSDIATGCDLVVMKGAPTTAGGGIELARVPSIDRDSWAWDSYVDSTVKITNPDLCTGTFDLYFVLQAAQNDGGTSNFGNMRWFSFGTSYENITGPSYTDGTTISASASVDRYVEDPTQKARLLLAEYNANGTMVALNKSEEKTIPNSVLTNFAISGVTKNAGTSYLGAYLWSDDDTILKAASIGSAGSTSGSVATEKAKAEVDNTNISVTGSGITDDRVLIAVVKKDTYDASKPVYENNPVQIWETAVVDGKYDYKFKMRVALDVPSGDYYVIVKGATTDEKAQFTYKSPDDIYQVLAAMDDAADSAVIAQLTSNAGVFGIESEIYTNISAFDMAEINTKVQAVFDNTPLVSGLDNYDSWVSEIKTVVAPQAVMSYIKNVKNVTKISEYVVKYEALLGINSNTYYTSYYKEPVDATDIQKAEYAKNRASLSQALTSVTPSTALAAEFVACFEESVVVGKFNMAESWGYADDALRTFQSELGLDISDYMRLKNDVKNEMMDKFLNRGFNNKAEIVSLFNALIGQYNVPENYDQTKYDRIPSDLGEEEIFVEMLHIITEETVKDDNAFSDISGLTWAVDSINYMSQMGYVNG